MKKYKKTLPVVGLVMITLPIYSQTTQKEDSTTQYYLHLAKSSDISDKTKLKNELYEMLKSNKEKDWLTSRRFFNQLKEGKTADSITSVGLKKFPIGQMNRDSEVSLIYNEKDPTNKEKLFKVWMKKFPPENFSADQQIIYDYARSYVAMTFAENNNVEKAMEYADLIKTSAWKGEGWAGIAQVLQKNGHLKEAEELYKKARTNAYEYMTLKRNEPMANFAAVGYASYSRKLAGIYVQQENYTAALPLLKEAHDSSKTINGTINSDYANVLSKLGYHQEAFYLIDEAIKAGQATPEMKNNLKILYPKVKGSDAGFEEYIESVNNLLIVNIRKQIAKEIIKIPAPKFTLKDVDGNLVSLTDFKGKTVIVDFWATWCGPCKASFPSMKKAMERFKDDPNVKFVFIHTWERAGHATDSAKAFINLNCYPFHVLMDLKNEQGVNSIVEAYKVSGIPTKFVIDGEGNIRFKFTGFNGGLDAAVEEVAAMIELAKTNI